MMETWRLNVNGKNDTPIRRAFDPGTSRPIVQQACNICRAKKLRCTGEKTGCSRCKALDRVCVYAEAGKKRRREPIVNEESLAIPPDRNLSKPPQRPAAKASPSSSSMDQQCHKLIGYERPDGGIGCSATRNPAHGPPMPLSDSAGVSNPDQCQTQPAFTVFSLYADFEHQGHILEDTGNIGHWSLIENIDVAPWDPRLVTPPDDPIVFASETQAPVLPSGGPSANEVTQPSEGLADLLIEEDRPWIGDTSGSTLSMTQAPELTDRPGSAAALEDSHKPECRCLQPVVFLIDELEAAPSAVSSQGLDSGLASHKEALRYGKELLECQRCRSRPEHMTILKFLTDKLAGLSEQLVTEYARCLIDHHTAARKPDVIGQTTVTRGDADCDSRSNVGALPWPTMLGSYEVDSPREWNMLIGALISLQLEALHSLVDSMKAVSRSMGWDVMHGKVAATQRRIVPMLYRIQSLCRPEGGGTAEATLSCNTS